MASNEREIDEGYCLKKKSVKMVGGFCYQE